MKDFGKSVKGIVMEKDEKHFSGGKRYRNKDITVYWKPSTCVHASYCYRELIEVFDPSRRPWVDMAGSTTEKIIEVVNLCPTDALTWKYNDEALNDDVRADQFNHIKFRRPELIGALDESSEEIPVSAKVMIDGPIVIKGDFDFNYGTTKKEVRDGMISICRCGVSDHQPFCDGRHRKIGFNG